MNRSLLKSLGQEIELLFPCCGYSQWQLLLNIPLILLIPKISLQKPLTSNLLATSPIKVLLALR